MLRLRYLVLDNSCFNGLPYIHFVSCMILAIVTSHNFSVLLVNGQAPGPNAIKDFSSTTHLSLKIAYTCCPFNIYFLQDKLQALVTQT